MQEENGHPKGFLDKVTVEVIKRYSRRGLLGNLGKKGLVLASATGLAGIGLGIDTSPAGASTHIATHASVSFDHAFEPDLENPDCVTHPPGCYGGCIDCAGEVSSCTTGGARCSIHLGCNNCCVITPVRAYGYYDCYGLFHCTTLQC